MKAIRYSLLVLIILAASNIVFAAPFLTADPYPAKGERPAKFLVTIGGKTVVSMPAKNADGSVSFKYDLGGLPDGTYTVSVKAVDKKGIASPPGVCSIRKTGSKVEIFGPPAPKNGPPAAKSGKSGPPAAKNGVRAPRNDSPAPKNGPPAPKNGSPAAAKKTTPDAPGLPADAPGTASGGPCSGFLDKTAGLRKDFELKRQEYWDLKRDPKAKSEDLAKRQDEVRALWKEIQSRNPGNCHWQD